MELRFISNHDIDPIKWDQCIATSANRLIYADYIYLQHMAPKWEALIWGDYEAVMPVACNKKWGIRYAYQPAFLQQTGIFTAQPITNEMAVSFMLKLIGKYPFIEIHLPAHLQQISLPYCRFYPRNNYVLPLYANYEAISASYSSNLRQRVNKSLRNGLQYEHLHDPAAAICIYYELNKKKIGGFSERDYEHFTKLCIHYFAAGSVMIRGVREKSSGQLLACVLLLKDEKRIYNMASSLYPEGKKLLANYFLYDRLIEECSGKDLLFDFEGSDVPGIANFYNRFPVELEKYCLFRHNDLPLPLRWLKPRV